MATISTKTAKLPPTPFDGQIFTDVYRTKWQWNAKLKVWTPVGTADQIPLASDTQDGLLSASDKAFLDTIPSAGGGFGIIVQPTVLRTPDNPDGVIKDDITLVSDSLKIECVDSGGEAVSDECGNIIVYENYGEPGLKFSLSEDFLDTLCVEVKGAPGKQGEQGPKGLKGKDGFNDGPAGDQGDPGVDATVAKTFSGVKIVDTDDITDTAVVSMELNASEGKLTYTKAKIAVPDNDTPADKVIASPLFRAVEYPFLVKETCSNGATIVTDELDTAITSYIGCNNGTRYSRLDEWKLVMPPNDTVGTEDVLLLMLNKTPKTGEAVTYSTIKLSEFIKLIVKYYQGILCDWEKEWEKEIKAFIESKDSAARTILANLAQQAAECEFAMPLEFCVGIQESDCHTVTPKVIPVTLVSPPVTRGYITAPFSVSTIISSGASFTSNMVGLGIAIVRGTGAGQSSFISVFNSSQSVDISPAFSVTPDATSMYQINPGLSFTADADDTGASSTWTTWSNPDFSGDGQWDVNLIWNVNNI